MPLDAELFNQAATRGQVAEASLTARLIGISLRILITETEMAQSPAGKRALESLDDAIQKSSAQFNELVGWTSDGKS